MARQVLPIAGAVIGGAIGGPMGAQIGFALGSIVGNAVDPQVIKGPALGEAGLQTSAEGVFRPVVYGTAAVKGNVIERGNRQVKTQRTSQGKGSGPVTEQQRVYWTFAIRICEAPIAGVLRIWQDEKLVYDMTPESVIGAETVVYSERFRLYTGEETQLPDPDLEAYKGIGDVNAYRGTAYIVFPNFDLTDFGERIPDFRFEISTATTETEIDQLDYDLFPLSHFFVGGITAGTVVYSDSINFALDTPIALVTLDLTDGGPMFPYLQLVRTQVVYDDGSYAYDSGWLGNPAQQTSLDALLPAQGYPELVGPITDTPGGSQIIVEIYPTRQIQRIDIYAARPVGPGAGTFGLNVQVDFPDDIPVGAQPFFAIPGVLILPDGSLIAAPWGPTTINLSGGSVVLGSVVAAIHQRSGQDAPNYNVAELSDVVEGLVLAGDYTCADAIRTLMPVYFFDASEHDSGTGYRIHYPKRGKPVVAVIDVNDLLDAQEKTVREDALERPKILHLHYENPTIGYAPAKATVRRDSTDIRVIGEQSVQIPVAFRDVNKPAQIASKLLKIAWVEVGGEEQFTISDNLLQIVPSDCIGLTLRGQTRRMRVLQEMVEPGAVHWKLIPDRQSTYTSNVTGVPVPVPTPPLPSIVGDTVYNFLDIPALNDNNDRLLWYEAASGQTEAWYGAQTQRKAGADIEFSNSATFNQNTIMGVLVNTVPAASEHYRDTTNTVRVQLYTDDVLESLTEEQFLSEGGSFALENADGSWEILQYRDSDDEGGGVFALTELLRGRLNTGGSAHAVDARFVLLDGVQSVDAITAWLNTTIVTRAVSFGQSPDGTTQYSNPYVGKSQIEFPVAHLFLDLDMDSSAGLLTASTVPRHRFGTEDNPVRSANWTGYRWTATDGSNSLSTDTIADSTSFNVTGWATPITVTVAQLNRFTGAGPTVSEQIT